QMERLVDDFRKEIGSIDAPGALDKGAVDLELRGIRVEIHFLMRMLAIEMRRDISGNHDHRNRIERGRCNARCRVREPWPEVREYNAGLSAGTRVAIGRVRSNLLMPGIHEPNGAALELAQHRDVRVTAQAKDVLDAAGFEIAHELARYEVLHDVVL